VAGAGSEAAEGAAFKRRDASGGQKGAFTSGLAPCYAAVLLLRRAVVVGALRACYARSDDRRLVAHLQVSYDQKCTTCDSGVYHLMCPNCVTGTKICTHSRTLQDCKECNGLGKVVYRGKLCQAHNKRKSDCKTCRDAELAGEKCFFGKRDGRAE
jgi:hypothetical protein